MNQTTALNKARATRSSKDLLTGLVALLMLAFSTFASAEYLGTVNGRSADFTRLPDLSLEASFNTGDFGAVDYQNLGLRVNYRLSPGLILLGDLGLTEIGRFDTTSLGLGAYYALSGLFENIDAALKGSYHIGDFDQGGDLNILSFEFLISGLEPISSNGLTWYANLGIHRADNDGSSDTEIGLGGGVVLPVSAGEAYLGVDLIDELTIGLGYRYFFQ